MLTELCLVRHAAYNVTSVARAADDRWDPPLTEAGVAQAEALAARLVRHSWSALVSSHLVRSLETARVLATTCSLSLKVDERWAEMYKGSDEVAGAKGWPDGYWQRWRDGAWIAWAGGETRAEVRARLLAAVEDIIARHVGERVLIVTHGGVVNELLSIAAGGDPKTLFRTDLTGVTRIGVDGRHWVVGSVNDVWHLEDALTLPLETFAYRESV